MNKKNKSGKNKSSIKLALYIGLGLIFILFILSFLFKKDSEYKRSLTFLPKIEVDNLKKKISDKDNLYVYIGSEDCPYCVGFLPKMVEANKEAKKHIFHMESGKNEKENKFFKENNIEYIPTLLKIQDGKIINLNINDGINDPKDYRIENIKAILEKD